MNPGDPVHYSQLCHERSTAQKLPLGPLPLDPEESLDFRSWSFPRSGFSEQFHLNKAPQTERALSLKPCCEARRDGKDFKKEEDFSTLTRRKLDGFLWMFRSR